MKPKKLFVILLCMAAVSSFAGGIAVLKNGEGRHNDEFDAAFEELGYTCDSYKDTEKSFADFLAKVGGYDLVLVSPLFNLKGDLPGEADLKPVRDYLEQGGMLVITDGSYGQVRRLFEPAVGDLVKLESGKCTSSQWAANGYTRNVEPVHPVRSFPNVTGHPDSWPHFTKAEAPWQVLAVCSEGKPVMLYRAVGKGCVVISTLRHSAPAEIENFRAYSQLLRCGLLAKTLTMTPLRPGAGSLSLELAQELPAGTGLFLEIENGAKEKKAFSAAIAGKTASLDFEIPWRGAIAMTLSVGTDKEKKVAFRREATLPPLLRVGPNAYRGILSTKRRVDEVQFPVYLAPFEEKIGGAKLTLSICVSNTTEVTSLETEIPTNDIPGVQWIPIPLDRDLPAGDYRIDARLTKPAQGDAKAIDERSSAPFEILAPRLAQTIIDDDGTFLVNGRPFFPLGIYHPETSRMPDISAIGFNAVQFWKWAAGDDGYGSPPGLDMAQAYGLKCLFESNHRGHDIWRFCAENYGTHPALLMWYVADEPAEGSESFMRTLNDIWHKYDKHHPTYICSCRPDLIEHQMQFADVFGFDHYLPFDKVVDWYRAAEKKAAPHKATVGVGWAALKGKSLEMIRPTAYVGLVHNVRGLYWYCWNQVGGGPVGIGLHTAPEAFATYKEVLAELRYLKPGLVSTTRRTFEEGPIHGIALGDRRAEGRRYLVMVNTSTNEVAADFAVPELRRVRQARQPFLPKVERLGKDGKPVKDNKGKAILDEAPVAIERGRLVHTFEPRGTYVLRW